MRTCNRRAADRTEHLRPRRARLTICVRYASQATIRPHADDLRRRLEAPPPARRRGRRCGRRIAESASLPRWSDSAGRERRTRKLSGGAGCTVKTVRRAPRVDHSMSSPEGASDKWNTVAADEPARTTRDPCSVGCVHDPLLAGPGRAQPRARGGSSSSTARMSPAATVAELTDVLREQPERHGAGAATRASGQEDRARRLDDGSGRHRERHGPSRHLLVVRRGRRSRRFFSAYQFKGPEAVPVELADCPACSSGPPTLPHPPGWRNWSDAAALKAAVPRDIWVRVPAPASLVFPDLPAGVSLVRGMEVPRIGGRCSGASETDCVVSHVVLFCGPPRKERHMIKWLPLGARVLFVLSMLAAFAAASGAGQRWW